MKGTRAWKAEDKRPKADFRTYLNIYDGRSDGKCNTLAHLIFYTKKSV